jgi:hypothetical protein
VARAETLRERVQNYRKAVQNPTDPVSAVVNNQIALFMMVLCGEKNDETIEMAGEGMHWYMSLLRGQALYWQRLHEQNRAEVFSQVESYRYAAVRAPEAFFFGTSDDEKIAQAGLGALYHRNRTFSAARATGPVVSLAGPR